MTNRRQGTDSPPIEHTRDEKRSFDDNIRLMHDYAELAADWSSVLQGAELDPETDRVNPADPRKQGAWMWMLMIMCVIVVLAGVFYFTSGDDKTTALNDGTEQQSDDASNAELPVGDGVNLAPDTGETARVDAAVDPNAEGESAQPPTHEELAAEDPIALTDGTWRFFADAGEAKALYDFKFNADGTVYEHDAADHTAGTYVADGASVTLTVFRTEELSASIPGKGERSEMGTWTEWFTMTRVGNTMTGTWTGENWRFGFDDGFQLTGEVMDRNLPGAVVFARPEHPEDPG